MIEQKQIEYAKEIGDVGKLLVQVVKVIKKREELGESIDELVNAIDNIGDVSDEMAANPTAAYQTMGLHLGELVGELLAKEEPAPSA